MKRKINVRPQARLDLLEIWHHIAADSVQNANLVTDRIETAIRNLAAMPGMGHERPDVDDPRYRFWSVSSYVIAYRFDATTLVVVRVVHGSRDFRGLIRG
ncbi:MAG TPA: type II toxin-antitoxin system RelE/ParE family toxin [Humisphaera sp.]